MSRHSYFELMRQRAREVREAFGLSTPRVRLSDMRRIYKEYGIRIDLWPYKLKDLRGAYFCDDLGPTVMLAKCIPAEPRIFTMGHELKHHLVDRHEIRCAQLDRDDPIEIGAEVFAAELIFPERDFCEWCAKIGLKGGSCTPEGLVHLKRASGTTMSYAGLQKHACRLGFARPETFTNVKWKKLEEQLYGEPVYKVIQRRRAAAEQGKTLGERLASISRPAPRNHGRL